MSLAAGPGAALVGILARIAKPRSGRSNAIFAGGCALGRLVAHGYLGRDEAERLGLEASLATGKPEREALAHLRRGLRRGLEAPQAQRVVAGGASTARGSVRTLAPVAGPPSGRCPPTAEVAALWATAIPVTDDLEAAAYLAEQRAIDPEQVALWDLARALPPAVPLPGWARLARRSWSQTGHRLVFRMFDARGMAASLRARCIASMGSSIKSLAPTGYSARGLVLACPLTVQLLRAGPPAWWTEHEIVICEGEMDFLVWAARQRECDERGAAIVGVASGSWSQALAQRIPTEARVVIRTHHDAAGDRYARQVHASLAPRCAVLRSPEVA